MKAEARFKCPFCEHEEFGKLRGYFVHLSAKHPQRVRDKYPPVTVFRALEKKSVVSFYSPSHD